MRSAGQVTLAGALMIVSACIDFDAARAQCDRPGGRCFTSAGASDGGWALKYTEKNRMPLNAVWVSPSGIVSAAGLSSTLTQGDGLTFHEVQLPTAAYGLTGAEIAGKQSLVTTGPNAGYRVACILPFDWNSLRSNTFDQIGDTNRLSGVWTAGSQVYVGGSADAGYIAKLTDAGWREQTIQPQFKEVLAGWGNASGYVFISDDPFLVRVPNMGAAETVRLPAHANAVSGGTTNNVWVAGDNGFVGRLVGTMLTRLDTAPGYSWGAIMPISDTHVFVAGTDGTNATIGEWDGAQWRISNLGQGSFRAMHGTSLSTLWAVDSQGSLWHFE